jgi:hypothetical protein
MGLDQYAYSVSKADRPLLDSQEYYDGEAVIESQEELAYWRKHADLNGWMTNLYHSKGGEGSFNGEILELNEDDLNSLQEAVKEGLETATGFFWGVSDERHDNETVAFIKKALREVKKGNVVYYCCSW